MDEKDFEVLKLDNQMCFPLYVCGKEITRIYKPLLEKLDLTYTQYVTMMVLWEEKSILLKDLGKKLFLDSGTLTPLLKKLEAKGYVTRQRGTKDDRDLLVTITKTGMDLRTKALHIPELISKCVALEEQEALSLYTILHKIMEQFAEK